MAGSWERRYAALSRGLGQVSAAARVPASSSFRPCAVGLTTERESLLSDSATFCSPPRLPGLRREPDFLPLKCDACKQDFCKDHFTYTAHKCPYAFKKDVQVPVCPLCNNPIPIKKGQIPDVVVGEHIDRDCKSHPGRREKIFTYRCSKEGCRRKEMLRVACDQCHGNFCIQHRHPLDHSCTRGSRPITAAGLRVPCVTTYVAFSISE
ncbi:AN1-type zinc finger protein 2A isoform X3 [Equus quagga]|uniref:AN1-type zinc finger protein 2A isoform X3 n=1 Tax=Equus quagga TaxID=89248 RepID=UPI001EE22ED6|nr:AN1-type zinc finger protein 2A isoform X3 [Equus quagga]